MGGVQQVRQVGETLTHWVAEIAGVRREWDAEILEQVPDQKVAWAATTGATNAGTVYFDAVGEDRTRVRLTLDYQPEGIVEKIGDMLDIVERQAVADLDRFKSFIESRGSATGAWRGNVDDTGAPPVGADAAAAGGVAAGEVAQAGLRGDTRAGTSAIADDPAGRVGTDDDAGVPGDIVAVGPTGDTRGTLDTEPGEARSTAPRVDENALGHSGDPVAVDPDAVRAGSTSPTADAASSSDTGVAGFGTNTGLSSSPTSGVVTGDPGSGTAGRHEAERTGTAAGAGTSGTGVAGFGTDTGLSSDDPASGAFTGDPGGRAASHTGGGDLVGEQAGWAAEPGARSGVTEAATDPVDVGAPSTSRHSAATVDGTLTGASTAPAGESWEAPGTGRHSATRDVEGAGGPGERRGVADSAGEGVVQRDYADENLTTDDVVARDFANRDITGQGTVQRDFANRDITEGDIENRGIEDRGAATGMGGARVTPAPQPSGLDALGEPGRADDVGAKLDPLDPRAGTADDPDNPVQPNV
jgi:hypothetical protein